MDALVVVKMEPSITGGKVVYAERVLPTSASGRDVYIVVSDDTALDSPRWLSTTLQELKERNFVRVNDPRGSS